MSMDVYYHKPFKLGLFKKDFFFESETYGAALINTGKSLIFYATDKEHKNIFCSVELGKPGRFRKEEFYIYSNEKYFRLRYPPHRIVIDFENHTCSCTSDKMIVYGSEAWGNDILLPWDNSFDDIRY